MSILIYPDSLKSQKKFLVFRGLADSDERMIRGGFLGEEDRKMLIALARDGSAVCRVTRRANALVLLDDGWSCRDVANAFLLDDGAIRGWRKLFEQRGIEGLTSFDMGGSASFLSAAQEDELRPCRVRRVTSAPGSRRNSASFTKAARTDRAVASAQSFCPFKATPKHLSLLVSALEAGFARSDKAAASRSAVRER